MYLISKALEIYGYLPKYQKNCLINKFFQLTLIYNLDCYMFYQAIRRVMMCEDLKEVIYYLEAWLKTSFT